MFQRSPVRPMAKFSSHLHSSRMRLRRLEIRPTIGFSKLDTAAGCCLSVPVRAHPDVASGGPHSCPSDLTLLPGAKVLPTVLLVGNDSLR